MQHFPSALHTWHLSLEVLPTDPSRWGQTPQNIQIRVTLNFFLLFLLHINIADTKDIPDVNLICFSPIAKKKKKVENCDISPRFTLPNVKILYLRHVLLSAYTNVSVSIYQTTRRYNPEDKHGRLQLCQVRS
jgi:hypothetical protein